MVHFTRILLEKQSLKTHEKFLVFAFGIQDPRWLEDSFVFGEFPIAAAESKQIRTKV